MFPQCLVLNERLPSWHPAVLGLAPSDTKGNVFNDHLQPPSTHYTASCTWGGCTNNMNSWPELAAAGGQEERGREKAVERKRGSKEGRSLFVWLSTGGKHIWSHWGCSVLPPASQLTAEHHPVKNKQKKWSSQKRQTCWWWLREPPACHFLLWGFAKSFNISRD